MGKDSRSAPGRVPRSRSESAGRSRVRGDMTHLWNGSPTKCLHRQVHAVPLRRGDWPLLSACCLLACGHRQVLARVTITPAAAIRMSSRLPVFAQGVLDRSSSSSLASVDMRLFRSSQPIEGEASDDKAGPSHSWRTRKTSDTRRDHGARDGVLGLEDAAQRRRIEIVRGAREVGTLDEVELRERLGLHPRGSRDFFDALVALGMLEREDSGRYCEYRSDRVCISTPQNPPTWAACWKWATRVSTSSGGR